MKVYVVTEYGGSYDDAWDKIIGIFTDEDKAEEVKDTYWTKVQKRFEEVSDLLEVYRDMEDVEDSSSYGALISESYNLEDIAGVKIDEYTLDKFLGGYYHG